MKISQLTILLISLDLTFWMAQCQLTMHLTHPTHQEVVKRHSLSVGHKKLVIHHDMRVFSTLQHQSLSHDTGNSQNYRLNQMGYFFTLNLTISGLPYRLNIDTGSSDIFIKGQDSPGNPQVKYTCQQCRRNNEQIQIGYLDGYLQTYQTTLDVQIGNHKFNESILVAYTAPTNFENAEGLVGLSFPVLARNHGRTFLKTLIDNKIVDKYAFGVNLNFQSSDHSSISFGSADQSLFEGNIKYYSLESSNSYVIRAKGFSFDNSSIFASSSALLDTGNTCISLADNYQDDILKQFHNNENICGFYAEENAPKFKLLRCVVKNFNALPTLKIHIGDEIYDIDKDVYFQRCYKGVDDKGDFCDTYIESVSDQSDLIYLGDGFFNRYYAMFDLENKNIGLAKNKEVLSYKNMYLEQSQDIDDINFFEFLLSQK